MTKSIAKSYENKKPISSATQHFIKLCLPPLLTILCITFLNYCYHQLWLPSQDIQHIFKLNLVINFIYWSALALSCYWLIIRIINKITSSLLASSFLSHHQTTSIVLPFLTALLKTVVFLVIFNTVTPYLGFPAELSYILEKLSSILIIGAIAWLLFKLINIAEQLVVHYYTVNTTGDVSARKIYTQMLILKRIAIGLIIVLASGAVLMLFENVRAIGASVLTTAGVIGLVLTFTAQRSLASIFSGLEIVLTQPIKIGDSIVIENEQGVVEEINFRSVIVKLWDWRRLVVPTNYFLEKPFQNWSREQSNNLIGIVYLYVDYTLPVEELRQELKSLLKTQPLWDGNICVLHVTDLKPQVMELRVLASARSPAEAFDLRCLLREKLIAYIAKNHPTSLPFDRYTNFPK